MSRRYDAVVIGSGPNGMSAAIALAESGASVHVVEASATLGGGTRTAELTEPGFLHDVCSAVHPMGILSPYLQRFLSKPQGSTGFSHRISRPPSGRGAGRATQSLEETGAD